MPDRKEMWFLRNVMNAKFSVYIKASMALGAIAVTLLGLPIVQSSGMQEAHAQASAPERNAGRDSSRNRGEERFINWETATERPEAEPFIWGGDGPSQQR